MSRGGVIVVVFFRDISVLLLDWLEYENKLSPMILLVTLHLLIPTLYKNGYFICIDVSCKYCIC